MISYFVNCTEQGVDAGTLDAVKSFASTDQLAACGLKTINQQMRFKKLLVSSADNPLDVSATCSTAAALNSGCRKKGKVTMAEIKDLPTEERQLYYAKYEQLHIMLYMYIVNYSTQLVMKISYRACLHILHYPQEMKSCAEEWPGNNIPTFHNNPANTSKLDALVKRIAPSCKLTYFDGSDIRLHNIMNFLSERRNIKNGYDYENVSCQLLYNHPHEISLS